MANSMIPWIPVSGVGVSDPGVQSGHSEHPSPDPVRRTAPPVPIIRILSANDSQAAGTRKRGRPPWEAVELVSGDDKRILSNRLIAVTVYSKRVY